MTEQELKELVKNTEERFIWYKKEMENIGRNRDHFPPDDPFIQWYKAHVREMKNMEDTHLTKLREELTLVRQGVNAPLFYRKF